MTEATSDTDWEATSVLPLLPTEVELSERCDGFDEAIQPSMTESHLARLKEALLLYVNAKYVQLVAFKTLEPKLKALSVGLRSVNGAWRLVRDALRGLNVMDNGEAQAVATQLIQSLTCACPSLLILQV